MPDAPRRPGRSWRPSCWLRRCDRRALLNPALYAAGLYCRADCRGRRRRPARAAPDPRPRGVRPHRGDPARRAEPSGGGGLSPQMGRHPADGSCEQTQRGGRGCEVAPRAPLTDPTADALRPTTAVLASWYAVLSCAHLVMLSGRDRAVMTGAAAGSSFFLVGLWRRLAEQPRPGDLRRGRRDALLRCVGDHRRDLPCLSEGVLRGRPFHDTARPPLQARDDAFALEVTRRRGEERDVDHQECG